MQIHCCYTVVVGSVAAAPAAEQMLLLVPVRLFPVAALRAGLTRVGGIDFYHELMISLSLVDKLLFKVVERP